MKFRTRLAKQKCVPCRGGVPSMPPNEVMETLLEIPGWRAIDNHHLERTFTFPDFQSAIAFVNAVGEAAEDEGHHPEILFTWGRATVRWWTHKINGMVKTDFILAARTSELYEEQTP